jgi:hypothetical protein
MENGVLTFESTQQMLPCVVSMKGLTSTCRKNYFAGSGEDRVEMSEWSRAWVGKQRIENKKSK